MRFFELLPNEIAKTFPGALSGICDSPWEPTCHWSFRDSMVWLLVDEAGRSDPVLPTRTRGVPANLGCRSTISSGIIDAGTVQRLTNGVRPAGGRGGAGRRRRPWRAGGGGGRRRRKGGGGGGGGGGRRRRRGPAWRAAAEAAEAAEAAAAWRAAEAGGGVACGGRGRAEAAAAWRAEAGGGVGVAGEKLRARYVHG